MGMEFTGEYLLPVARQRVWDALNDPAVLQASIAGCQQLDKLSDTEFSAVVTSKVGPMAVTFRGAVELTELDPPNGYLLTGRGQGGAAGFARMSARVMLSDVEGGQTLLHYSAQAEIGGKLASVGSRLIQTVAKKNADDFFAAFARQLSGEAAALTSAPERLAPAAVAAPLAPQAVVAGGGGLGAPVPAWLVVFGSALGAALGYCMALLAR
ncbi:MAG: carbon monoxide dehydrogenase subunit G [Hydrogenophaga sp.]|nr:carbon monoxide dehydrogenase subunit G [Hydrogenophaga sp.]